MKRVSFGYEGINIGVTSECREDIAWLTEFLVPWFDQSVDPADVEVSIRHDQALFSELLALPPTRDRINAFMLDTSLIDFPRWFMAGKQLVCYDESFQVFYLVTNNRIDLICGDHTDNIRVSIMRVVREVAMGVAQLLGGRFLHASAFALDNRAVIITGPREAGKTSLLSYVLSNSKATFLANDRLLVNRHGPSIQCRGMPTIVSIRAGTMDLFPQMRKSIEKQRFTARVSMKEARQSKAVTPLPTRDGRWGLSSRQFCSVLGCEPQQEARGSILLFPRRTGRAGGIVLRQMEIPETRVHLQHSLFGNIGPDSLSDAFTIMPPDLQKQAITDDECLFTSLENSLTVFDCELGNDAYEGSQGVDQLLQILEDSDPPEQGTAVNTAIKK